MDVGVHGNSGNHRGCVLWDPSWGIVVRKWKSFGSIAFGFMVVLAFLVLVEIKMIVVKWAIVKNAWRKAANIDREAGHAAGSFDHDVSQEAKAMDQENLLGKGHMICQGA